MSREFDSERDVPLLVIFGVTIAIGVVGVTAFAEYTPLDPHARWVLVAGLVLPVATAPVVYYVGYTRERLRPAYAYVALVCVFGAAVVGVFRENGSRDESEPELQTAVVVARTQGIAFRARPPKELRLALWGPREGRQADFAVSRGLWNSVEAGDEVVVVWRAGYLGIPWVDEVRAVEE